MPTNQGGFSGMPSNEAMNEALKTRSYANGDYAGDKAGPAPLSDLSSFAKDSNYPTSQGAPRALSFGEQLVGITFNPSNDGDVNFIKTKMAEVANLIHDQYQRNETSPLAKLIFEGAIHDILNAQMNAVKYVTLKY